MEGWVGSRWPMHRAPALSMFHMDRVTPSVLRDFSTFLAAVIWEAGRDGWNVDQILHERRYLRSRYNASERQYVNRKESVASLDIS